MGTVYKYVACNRCDCRAWFEVAPDAGWALVRCDGPLDHGIASQSTDRADLEASAQEQGFLDRGYLILPLSSLAPGE